MEMLSAVLYHLLLFGLLLLGWMVIALHAVTFRVYAISSGLALLLWMITAGASGLWWLAVTLLWVVPVVVWAVPGAWMTAVAIPAFNRLRAALPPLSQTEREALEAGHPGWEEALFAGDGDWKDLLRGQDAELSQSEQAFLSGPVDQVCAMLDDWKIHTQWQDMPEAVWARLREDGFFGMVLPSQYGGLAMSARAHSEVVMKLASRSIVAAVTVMVPNSLGPGKLLLRYGTDAQKNRYLPALATGEQMPCFGLTAPRAGSDAASIRDSGVICRQTVEGEEVLGVRLNWEKRYITLAPVATLIGLAFRLYDPDGLLGEQRDLGITLALVPAQTPGVEIGRRHQPMQVPFMNGPITGRDVFIPMQQIIGEEAGIGCGWRMLMECLGEGRSISLPALAVAAGKYASRQTGAYAAVRRQFSLPLAKFEGVQESLAQIAGNTYLMDAVRVEITRLEQAGECSSIASAIAKQQLTERMRRVVIHSMDIHAGAGICAGPRNVIARLYQAIPIAITVEGANLLTRNLIIFGQGLTRCHPYLLEEMRCLQKEDNKDTLQEFNVLLRRHIGATALNATRSFMLSWTGGRYPDAQVSEPYWGLVRQSACFSWVVDVMLLVYGGSLKRRERISARLADMLSAQYMAVCVARRYAAAGAPAEDKPLRDWALAECQRDFSVALAQLIDNLEHRALRFLLRLTTSSPFTATRPHRDTVDAAVARLIATPGATRDRLCAGVYQATEGEDPAVQLERAFAEAAKLEPARRALRKAVSSGQVSEDETATELKQAVACGVLDQGQADALQAAEQLIDQVIAVDAFEPEVFASAQASRPKQADHHE